ncbi:MAG: glycosyltransferase, partial [Chloroflexi bacterium]|nr:glycosyltransferase [Chloroflexota bacterium]
VDDLVLDHHGYVADEAELRKKQERNQRLLEAAIAAEPEEPFHYFNLGKHYYGTGRIAEAAEPLRRAVALCISDSASYLVNAYAMLVVALGQGGRGEEVEATLAEAERRLPTLTADFLCNAGSAYQATGKLEQALVYFQRAIDAGGARTACGSDPATHTWRPRFGIGIINEALGNLEGAQASYEEALTYFPTSPLLHCRMAKVAARMGQPEKALQLIERALQSGVVPTELLIEMLQVCEALAEAGSARQSATPGLEEVGGQLVQRIQPAPEYGAALAAACSRFGQYERGIAAASATLERREDVLARVNRGFCYFALGRYQEASEDFSAALAMKPDDPRVLADLSAALQRLEGVQTPGAGVPAGSASERPLSESEAGAEQAKGAAVPVSIIIPVFNKVEATRRCIEAIVGNTPDDLYEAIVVDDGSTDGTKDFLGLLAGDVEVITNEKNCGYYQACRQGSQKARGKYLVFLSNEAEPRPGWLESSVALAESDGSIGAVGAKLVYPDGTLDEAGAIAFSDGATWQYGRGMDPADPQLSFVREVDYCSAVGLLVRRDLWDGIGGFSLQFAPTDYEAADLCFAIRRAGYKVVYQPAASVVHHKEASARAG